MNNATSVVMGKEIERYYSVYLIVKRKNNYAAFLFNYTAVQSAVDKLPELVEIKKAFEILKSEFVIKRDQALDG